MSGEAPSPVRVLVSDPIAEPGLDLLRSSPDFEVEVRTGIDEETLAEVLPDFDGLIVRSGTRVTARVLESPGRLRIVGRAGVGVDNIDLAAATAAGVVVVNAPGANSIAAAEHTLALLFAMVRNLPRAHAELLSGLWERKKNAGVEVTGKTLGILGLGRIGREVATRAGGLGMVVVGHDPVVDSETAAAHGVRLLPFDEVLEQADILTLHLPVNDRTRHLIDADALNRLRHGARIINAARGGLVDENALLAALESGRIAGAALDVYETEPPPEDHPLLSHPGVVCTPHLGASTAEAQERVSVEIAGKVRDYLLRGILRDAVIRPG